MKVDLSLSLKGRIGRLTYILSEMTVLGVCGFILGFPAVLRFVYDHISADPMFLGTVKTVHTVCFVGAIFVAYVYNTALGFKRLHDLGWTGGLIFVGYIPPVAPLVGLVLVLLPGQRHDNQFGSVRAQQ
jgi:uncharacterized membrane protein YhaH (DUF805 family)